MTVQALAWSDFKRGLWAEHDGLCGICGSPVTVEAMQIDHITPQAKGGSDERDNLQPSHALCNIRKGDGSRPWTDARVTVHTAPRPILEPGVKYLNVLETADSLGVGPETVRRWIRAGKIHGVSYGSDRAGWRVAASEVERFKREGPAR